jgi:hypothetical protein
LKEGANPKATYRPESLSEKPEPPCLGSVNEPVAEAGNLCVYRGGNFGSLEKQDKNAGFFGFLQPNGNNTSVSGEAGVLGQQIVFRSTEFKEEEPPVEELAAAKSPVRLHAIGSWAVTEK